jgi:hypothetical protein
MRIKGGSVRSEAAQQEFERIARELERLADHIEQQRSAKQTSSP